MNRKVRPVVLQSFRLDFSLENSEDHVITVVILQRGELGCGNSQVYTCSLATQRILWLGSGMPCRVVCY